MTKSATPTVEVVTVSVPAPPTTSILDPCAAVPDRTAGNQPRPDLKPLIPRDAVSIWVKADPTTGEVDLSSMRQMTHAIGKTGAGFHAALDRIEASFEARNNMGYNSLEGYSLFGIVLRKAQIIAPAATPGVTVIQA